MSLNEEQVRQIVRDEIAIGLKQCLIASLDAEIAARKRVQTAIAEHRAEVEAAKQKRTRRFSRKRHQP
ncbi:hypothetical protein FK530_23065 [Tsukamurella conjunctivitidis]|uniref:Uncharacterized protein n=1 Tax=Tsukamurella conjunctivitidis TaxID=2592068 RepID=A0A5C5RT13_9ACTN|nr:hypothetical protein [Tsukamurella conjunctivitidis]TWS25603.1 hypothetical protein FK530_23065 [Tsukamurella conjunctivitidis]